MGDEPGARRRGLVGVEAEVEGARDRGQGAGQVELGRGRVDRVGLDDDQGVDRAVARGAGQGREVGAQGIDDDRRGELGGLAQVAEHVVEQVSQRVDLGRLAVAHQHQALLRVSRQVARDRVDPRGVPDPLALAGQLGGDRVGQAGGTVTGSDQAAEQLEGQVADATGRDRQALVGQAAGGRGAGLGHVEPPGVAACRELPATGGEVVCAPDRVMPGAHEVHVERHHHVGLSQPRHQLEGAAEGLLGAAVGVAAVERCVEHEPGGRVAGADLVHQRAHQRRALRQHEHPQALLGGQPGQQPGEVLARLRLAGAGGTLGPVGIVELEHRALVDRGGAAQAGRVFGVALDLDRSALEALDHQAGGVAVDDHRGGVLLGDAGSLLGWLIGARHDLAVGPLHAAAHPGQRGAGAQQLEQLASVHPGGGRSTPGGNSSRGGGG